MNKELTRYYESRVPLLKRSIKYLFPEKCTNDWVKGILAREERPWDLETLQTAFLDPINRAIHQKKTFYYALGGVLLLESSNINPEKFGPLIGISEAFDVCFQLLKNISIHEDHNQHVPEVLGDDSSIIANVGVALLTIPHYPIIHNYCNLDDETRLWLFQNNSKSVTRVFYANGASQFRQKKRQQYASFKEYQQNSYYLNGPKIKFTFDLWLSLTKLHQSKEIVNSCEEITRAFALTCQLLHDLKSYEIWVQKNKHTPGAEFSSMNNFILFHIAKTSDEGGIDFKNLTYSNLVMHVKGSGAENFMMDCIKENECIIKRTIDQLPFSIHYRHLIKSYILQMLANPN